MSSQPDIPVAALRRLAQGLLYDRHGAEDVVQEAWLAALRARPPATMLGGWLTEAVKRLARNRRREESRRAKREQSVARPEAQPGAGERAAQLEVLHRLLDALAALEEPYRSAVMLRYLDDLPPRAIAARLAIPVNTARTHVRRGLERLRRDLDGERGQGRQEFLASLGPFAGRMPWSTALGRPMGSGGRSMELVRSVAQRPFGLAAAVALLGGVTWFVFRGEPGSSAPGSELAAVGGTLAQTAEATRVNDAALGGTPGLREPAGTNENSTAGWTIRGHVSRGKLGAYPGVPLRGRIHGGYRSTDDVLLEASFTSDARGDFEWTLAPPERSVRVEVEAVLAEHDVQPAEELVARGDPAPEQMLVWAAPFDAELTGVVRDPAGHAVAGARLALGMQPPTTSAADGRYRLRLSSMQEWFGLSAALARTGAARIDLAPLHAGEVRELDVVLAPELVLHGFVHDESAAPIAGAKLRSVWQSMYDGGASDVVSDEHGRFELRLADDGDWIAHAAHKDGYAPARVEGGLKRNDGRMSLSRRIDPENVDVALTRGATVTGRVLDAARHAVEGALVVAEEANVENPPWCATDEQGRFTLEHVPFDDLELSAERRGFVWRALPLNLRDRRADVADVELVLETGGELAGVVLDAQDRPIPWARVAGTCTDAEGRFSAVSVSPAAKHVWASAPGFARLVQDLGDDREHLVLHLQPSAHLAGRVVDAETGEPIRSFTLKLFEAGNPNHGLEWANWTWRKDIRVSDPHGAWRIERDFAAGLSAGLGISADGYAPASLARIESTDDEGAEPMLTRLMRRTVVRGVVVDAETGQPLEAQVTLSTASGRSPVDDEHGSVVSDASGRFELTNVPSGPTWLAVERISWMPVLDGPFTVGSTPIERRIELGHGACVAGRLVDAQGQGLANEEVQVRGTDGLGRSAGWRYRTRPDGRFELANLAGGTYTLEWLHRQGEFPRFIEAGDLVEPFTLAPGERREVVLSAQGHTLLRGTLGFTGALPDVVPVALTLLDDAGAPTARGRGAFAERGLFTVPLLEPGRYQVTAEFELDAHTKAKGRASIDVPASGQIDAHVELVSEPK